jgi:hypothetical protein
MYHSTALNGPKTVAPILIGQMLSEAAPVRFPPQMAAATTRNGSARVKSTTATKLTTCDKNLDGFTGGIYAAADGIHYLSADIFGNHARIASEIRQAVCTLQPWNKDQSCYGSFVL